MNVTSVLSIEVHCNNLCQNFLSCMETLESFDEMFAAKTQTLHQMSRCYTLADPFYTNLFTQVSAVYFTVQGLV